MECAHSCVIIGARCGLLAHYKIIIAEIGEQYAFGPRAPVQLALLIIRGNSVIGAVRYVYFQRY